MKLRESVRGVRGSPFEAGFRRVFSRVRNRSTVNYVDSASPRPVVVHSDVNACSVYVVNVVHGTRRLAGRCIRAANNRFGTVANKTVGRARLITTVVDYGRAFTRNVTFTRSGVRNATSVLVLQSGNGVVYTHSELNEVPMVLNGNRSNCYISFRSFTFVGLNCGIRHSLNPNRVVRFGTSN